VPTPTDQHAAPAATRGGRGGSGPWGWSPPDLPADTAAKRRVDRFLPRTGLAALLYFATVAVLVSVAQLLGPRLELMTLTLAGVVAGGWCTVNFWRCRHAHCVVTGTGWLALAALTAAEAGLGRSVIGDAEPAIFGGILAAGLAFECAWACAHGTNAVGGRQQRYSTARSAAVSSCTEGAPDVASPHR
jgi:hypothetical protein